MTRRTRRWIAIALGVPIAATTFVAIAHTSVGRPLMAVFGGSRVGCPVSTANASPQQIEDQRAATMKAQRGAERAHARPALDFVLARTTRADVASWASARGATCTDELAKTALRCRDVAIDGGTIRDLYLRFDPGGALVGVDAMRDAASGDAAIALVDVIAAAVARDAGEATATRGETSGAALEGETYASRAVEFRFRDYSADVSATNFGAQGIVVREQYRAIPD
jgi:hypothetical protein